MLTNLLKIKFWLILFFIALFGFFLRLVDYNKVPPFDVTKDEFFYPWAGMSLLQTGVPKAWSLFKAYPDGEIVYKWNTWYRIVSPWVEKPPLYSLLAGSWVIVNGSKDLFDVRLSTLRILPITFSFFTIILVGLLGKSFFNKQIGYLSALFYSVVPTIVLANRISLVENLLTPIILLAVYLFSLNKNSDKWQNYIPYIIGFISGLAILIKNIGIALPVLLIGILLSQKKWRYVLIVGAFTFVFAIVHPLLGAYYGLNLFLNVMKEYQEIHAFAGLPEVVSTIFRFPIVAHQWDKIFPDGSMLAGYILLFSSPFWLKLKNSSVQNKERTILFLGFPFIYITLLALLESGGTPYSYFGWHVYPIFPFLMILLSKIIFDFWKRPSLLQMLFLYLVIGFSTIRFLLLVNPEIQRSWQWILVVILLIFACGSILKTKYRKMIFIMLFIIFLTVNVLVILNLNQIYPGNSQPLY